MREGPTGGQGASLRGGFRPASRTRAALAALVLSLASTSAAASRRWALVIGEDQGLSGEETLHYARSDALRVLAALRAVGLVDGGSEATVIGGDAGAVRAALAALGRRLAQEATRADWLTVYVSAHAGSGSLHLRGTELPLSELLDFLRASPVGVGLLVVDSCQAGSLTRVKGLRPAGPPVRVALADLEGRIVITSSGIDEYAQESDELGGSYFTHHLLAGLRGAADSSGDGRVSLEEAYAYAYARTVESTLGSAGGLQRPAFSKELHGRGELILSEPSAAAGRLTLAVDAPGRWVVIAAADSSLVADLEKGAGPATIALAPGRYRLRLRGEHDWLERSVEVPASGGAVLAGEDLERAALARFARRGGPRVEHRVALGFSAATGLVSGIAATLGVQARFRRDQPLLGPLELLSIGLAARQGTDALRAPFTQRELEAWGAAGTRLRLGAAELAPALEAGALLVLQSDFLDGSSRVGLEPFAAASIEARLPIFGPLGAFVEISGGAAVVRTLSGLHAVPRARGALGLSAGW
ncbi:MAG TPA: caspase family protein [Myxococcales bacterium]|nr:caspase family protein [Myxococcales bacterium]